MCIVVHNADLFPFGGHKKMAGGSLTYRANYPLLLLATATRCLGREEVGCIEALGTRMHLSMSTMSASKRSLTTEERRDGEITAPQAPKDEIADPGPAR